MLGWVGLYAACAPGDSRDDLVPGVVAVVALLDVVDRILLLSRSFLPLLLLI